MAKKKNDDVEFQFNEEYIRRFQAMQEERIKAEHANDEDKVRRIQEEANAKAQLKSNLANFFDEFYKDHQSYVKHVLQPMHDKMVKMGVKCVECTRNHYEYDSY
jgi:uncharacterized membrane protein YvbJ